MGPGEVWTKTAKVKRAGGLSLRQTFEFLGLVLRDFVLGVGGKGHFSLSSVSSLYNKDTIFF